MLIFLILGRPFLYTSRALIYMEKGKLLIRVGEHEVVFQFPLNPTPFSSGKDTLFRISYTNHEVSFSS